MTSADRDGVGIQATQRFVDPLIVGSKDNDAQKGRPFTRLVVMSDTHGLHRSVHPPTGDVLIHAGDLTQSGELCILQDLALYFDSMKDRYTSIIYIAGNHDLTLHPACYDEIWERFHGFKEDSTTCKEALRSCCAIYLEDSSCKIEGDLVVYGSPWTPYYRHWAFNFPPDNVDGSAEAARAKWKQIPEETDILITHGPPLGRCDLSVSGRAGCRHLLEQVQQRVQPPRVHLFGHIHEDWGSSFDGKTLYINASNLDISCASVAHPCQVIDVPHDRSKPARIVEPDCRHLRSQQDVTQWFEKHGYCELAAALQKDAAVDIPLGNELLRTDANERLVSAMAIQKNKPAKKQLHEALKVLFADAF